MIDPIWKASAAALLDQLGPLTVDRQYMIMLDTSASMPIRQQLGVAKFLFGHMFEKMGPYASMKIVTFDANVTSVQVINTPEDAVRINLMGGGGTCIRPVSDYMRSVKEFITAICITDGYIGDLQDQSAYDGTLIPPLKFIGKAQDRFGWFLIYKGGNRSLPGPQVFADDDRWIMFGDGPRLFTEEEEA